MFHVSFGLVKLLIGYQSLDPARIEIDEVTGAAAYVGQVLD